MNQATKKTQEMVKLALFAGIIVVLAMTPLGYLPLGVLRPTTIHIPVILGSILLGWKKGAALGGLFGLSTLSLQTRPPLFSVPSTRWEKSAATAGVLLSALFPAFWWVLPPTLCTRE